MNTTIEKESWGIIGLGWLGFELANKLRHEGHQVWGTHRSEFNFELDPFPATPCEVLLLNTPPLKNISPKDFVQKVSDHPAKRVIFISSTSVYGEVDGQVNELTPVNPVTASAKWLTDVESLLQVRFHARLTVMRQGG